MDIPESIVIDITELDLMDSVRIEDVVFPEASPRSSMKTTQSSPLSPLVRLKRKWKAKKAKRPKAKKPQAKKLPSKHFAQSDWTSRNAARRAPGVLLVTASAVMVGRHSRYQEHRKMDYKGVIVGLGNPGPKYERPDTISGSCL